MKIRILIIVMLVFISCKKEIQNQFQKHKIAKTETADIGIDTITISNKHKVNKILCDLDGDKAKETVEILRSTKSGKSGLRITFGNGNKIDYLGFGNDILGQGFDEMDWVGIFEKAPKNEIYWNNVNSEGEILSEDEIKEVDKIKLVNDGIFIHAEGSCGGGIIYLKNGKYEWIQQE